MIWGIRCCLILSVFFLTGCATEPPTAEKWQDPLVGMNLKDGKNPKILANNKNKKVPIVISQNTKGYVKTKKEVLSYFAHRDLGENQVASAADPKITANSYLAILKRQLPNDYYVASDIGPSSTTNFAVIIDRWAEYDIHLSPSHLIAIKDRADVYFVDPSSRTLLWSNTAEADIECLRASRSGLLHTELKFLGGPANVDQVLAECFAYNENALFNKLESGLKAVLPSPSAFTPSQGNDNEKYRDVMENGSDVQLYSVAMNLEQAENNVMASKVYQAIVQRFPQSPYAAKAIEHQEKLTRSK